MATQFRFRRLGPSPQDPAYLAQLFPHAVPGATAAEKHFNRQGMKPVDDIVIDRWYWHKPGFFDHLFGHHEPVLCVLNHISTESYRDYQQDMPVGPAPQTYSTARFTYSEVKNSVEAYADCPQRPFWYREMAAALAKAPGQPKQSLA